MLDLLTASPSVGAWRCEPMSIAEIDNHPERDRLWATIKAMQGASEDAADMAVAYNDRDADDAAEKAQDDEREECQGLLSSAIDRLVKGLDGVDATVIKKINDLRECLE